MEKQKRKRQRKKEVDMKDMSMDVNIAKEKELNNEVRSLYNDVYGTRTRVSLRKKILEGLH